MSMVTTQAPQGFDAENADNFEDIEKQFAVKAVQHLEAYWGILEKVPGSQVRLTKKDDEILAHLEEDFPGLDVSATINEDEMKSKSGKERWRKFMMKYEDKKENPDKVANYNFGTILRKNPKFEYGEKETIFVPRMQFYAIEIKRNQLGLNDWVYYRANPDKKPPTEK